MKLSDSRISKMLLKQSSSFYTKQAISYKWECFFSQTFIKYEKTTASEISDLSTFRFKSFFHESHMRRICNIYENVFFLK